MRIHLGGHLVYYQAEKLAWFEVPVDPSAALIEVIDHLGIPAAEIALWVVNGEAVEPQQATVCNQDVVQLFPPVDGG